MFGNDTSSHCTLVSQKGGGENVGWYTCRSRVNAHGNYSYSFSYEDYYDRNVHSARMPIMYAIRDSFGLKDVLMDSLDTLRGSKFNYRSFEPSEGVPHIGSSRTSRIMAGLRYSTSTAKKHWLEPAPVSRFLSAGRGMNGEVVIEQAEPLEFDDPDPWDEVEALYESSRTMVYGDYNYPVVDFRAPLWKQARYGNSSPTGSRARGYGGTDTSAAGMASVRKGKLRMPDRPPSRREGCVDVIVEQGKGNYVVVADISSQENEQQLSPTKTSPPPRSPRSPAARRQQQQQQQPTTIGPPRQLRTSRSTPSTETLTQHQQQRHLQPHPPHPPSSSLLPPSNPHPQPSFSSPQYSHPPSSSPPQQQQQQQQNNSNMESISSSTFSSHVTSPPDHSSTLHQPRRGIHQLFDEDNDDIFTNNVWK